MSNYLQERFEQELAELVQQALQAGVPFVFTTLVDAAKKLAGDDLQAINLGCDILQGTEALPTLAAQRAT